MWSNSFHQVKLDRETSERLSIQTPWGQFQQPKFMPEGIGPASGILQMYVSGIFSDFRDWIIATFDNLLVLAYDYEDAYRKCELIHRCIERNVFLQFSKTWLGFPEAKFFGYLCKHGSYELTQDRKDALKEMPFPSSLKKMQSFLGSALFFKSFVPHYSSLTAPLNDMAKKTFNWDKSTWNINYEAVFNRVKDALQSSMAIYYYPDYELDWILRTDASLLGVGAVLYQVKPHKLHEGESASLSTQEPDLLPIGFASQKFSEQATRWSTIVRSLCCIFSCKILCLLSSL
jgi:hypothetical protein